MHLKEKLNLRSYLERRILLVQFLRFAAIGASGTFIHYALLITLVDYFDYNPILSSTIGFAAGALSNYLLNYRFTFTCNKKHSETIFKFYIIAILGLGINTLIMSIAIDSFSIHYLLAQACATGLVLIWNFTGNLIWTFR